MRGDRRIGDGSARTVGRLRLGAQPATQPRTAGDFGFLPRRTAPSKQELESSTSARYVTLETRSYPKAASGKQSPTRRRKSLYRPLGKGRRQMRKQIGRPRSP